jgi:DNA-binding NarL/FixJ family response regulator
MTTERIRVIVADDHPIVRQGLRREIEEDSACEVVGEAGDGLAALATIRNASPDVAVIDLDMPRLDGFGVARAVDAERLRVALIFLTMYDQKDMFHRAMQLGARGYILKDSAVTEVVQGIKTVAAGHPYVSAPLLRHMLPRAGAVTAPTSGLDSLTPAERRILALVADGRSSKEIAAALFIQFRTVDNHRTNICQKLGLSGPNALLKFALEHRTKLP